MADPSTAGIYRTSPIKRPRRTKTEMDALRAALWVEAEAEHPTTDRHLFYVLVSQRLIAKDEREYKNVVCRLVLEMRRNGRLDHRWIADHTRWMRKHDSYDSLGTMLKITSQSYRRAVWATQPHYVEVWCEKDAVAGILYEYTEVYDVPLMVARGFSSESFLFNSAQALKAAKKPCYIYYFGDWDPSGVLIAHKIEQGLRRLAPTVELHFERVAVTPPQIQEWQLPTRPTKESTHSRGFTGESVELDAIAPSVLRELVREKLNTHLDKAALVATVAAEESEREILANMAKTYADAS